MGRGTESLEPRDGVDHVRPVVRRAPGARVEPEVEAPEFLIVAEVRDRARVGHGVVVEVQMLQPHEALQAAEGGDGVPAEVEGGEGDHAGEAVAQGSDLAAVARQRERFEPTHLCLSREEDQSRIQSILHN